MPELIDNGKAQSIRVKTGARLEIVTAYILNYILNQENIYVLKGTKTGLLSTINNTEYCEDIIQNIVKV
ncbi:hypothetical protein DRN76_01660 [Methanosarcinales archaeon]|nr:MAG: hypothetical protein DRN76_01660 [Methanosarcinales archaeon]